MGNSFTEEQHLNCYSMSNIAYSRNKQSGRYRVNEKISLFSDTIILIL